ncbi:chaperonin 10-like protein [Pseudomassariella vexata]|uniref:Chaperonin 10-like protein n=1 Tax=Pseudomassariella vexata TaxID=1141098 RepID=A0A1Y2EAR3_9PEZI|nr:chaperonin 10-like protein [Pseudomassariella vexata]ORY68632.1 chaperonin 10-like protein [Pseudomassariella vexata]
MANSPKSPRTMRSLAAPKYCKPADYQVLQLRIPSIKGPKDVLIKVHAAGLMTGDTLIISREMRFLTGKLPPRFPVKIGSEAAGIVVATGQSVTAFKPGDAVYGLGLCHPKDLGLLPGFCSEYCIAQESLLLNKPQNVSFEEATALLGFTLTAYQSISLGERRLAEKGLTLEGKTVFVPGALSATGAVGIQLLKNVYKVKTLISTVSTPKLPLVPKYLPGLVDRLIDYTTTSNLTTAIPAGSVDLTYNTQFSTLFPSIPLMNPQHGVMASISSVPAPSQLRVIFPPLPFWVYWVSAVVQG